MKKHIVCFFLFGLVFGAASAQLKLPSIIGDHMVLQQQSDATLWGWAGPGDTLAISGSWDKEIVVKTSTTNMGTWKTSLKTPVAGGPYTITIRRGKNESVISDVMIGEVWICAGQSNMQWSVTSGVADAKEDMPKANFSGIRLFQVDRTGADTPQVRGDGQWRLCTPESMKDFSAVGYFFGKKLHTDLKVPIGLINTSWGGTPAEVWIPKEKVTGDPALNESASKLNEFAWWPKNPGVVYNAMIRPLVPYGIAGAIWYQGESNTSAPATYAKLMQVMIESWRSDFGKEFPFYYVQIAPFKYGRNFEGALVREQQSKLLSVPKTGMVIITDAVDNVADIHPKFKKPVGDRLANYALGETYKRPILGYQSPVYKSMEIVKGKTKFLPGSIRISFQYAEIGLISRGGDPTQFTIAGADGKFVPAVARIDGGVVIVSSKEVKEPVAVRFCWDNTSIPNVFNKEGLPISCFRTDNWDLDMSQADLTK